MVALAWRAVLGFAIAKEDSTMPDIAAANWKVSDAARRLHQDALVWDNHAGFGPDPSVDLEILEAWRAAGVDYLSVNVGYDVISW